MNDKRLTFRCAVCATNWPYTVRYEFCPLCEEPCKGLELTTPSTCNDHILDWEEAEAVLLEEGVVIPSNVEQHVETLYRDFDRWIDEQPFWVKK